MKSFCWMAMGVELLSLLVLRNGLRAQDSRDVLEVIHRTAARSAPGASSKYMPPRLKESVRSVDRFVHRNRELNTNPSSSMFKNASTSSRRYLSTPSIDVSEEVYVRMTQQKITASQLKLPHSLRDPTDVELGRKAGRLAKDKITAITRNQSQSQGYPTDGDLGRKVGRLTKDISSRKYPVDVASGRDALQLANQQRELKNVTVRIGRKVHDLVR